MMYSLLQHIRKVTASFEAVPLICYVTEENHWVSDLFDLVLGTLFLVAVQL